MISNTINDFFARHNTLSYIEQIIISKDKSNDTIR